MESNNWAGLANTRNWTVASTIQEIMGLNTRMPMYMYSTKVQPKKICAYVHTYIHTYENKATSKEKNCSFVKINKTNKK